MCDECPNDVVELARRIRAYVEPQGWIIVGGLHIVIEDENVGDDHIEWCIANAHLDKESLEIAAALLSMGLPSRHMAVQMAWKDEDQW